MARFRRDLAPRVREALTHADAMMAKDTTGNIHSVGFGEKIKGGVGTGQYGVVVSVKIKGHTRGIWASPLVPRAVFGVPTDVIERPEAQIELLMLDDVMVLEQRLPSKAAALNRQCHDTPIPGGVEIQPEGKGWVGTLGCKVVYREHVEGGLYHGAITNWHVATGVVDQKITQPGYGPDWFGVVARSPGVSFSGTNKIDISILRIWRSGGKYGDGMHTVLNAQLTLGKYPRNISPGGVGTTVCRDGRTLGRITDGKISQIGATVRVGYSEGTALYIDQFVCTRAGGNFSAPGDSGSMVFDYPDMRPSGLLFAGGGGTTIVSPAEFALEVGVHSFQ